MEKQILTIGMVFITLILFINLINARDSSYLLNLHYNKGEISLNSIKLIDGAVSENTEIIKDGYHLEIYSGNKLLDYTTFKIPNEIFIDTFDGSPGNSIHNMIDETDFVIGVNYIEGMDNLKIKDPQGKQVFTTNLETINKEDIGSTKNELPLQDYNFLILIFVVIVVLYLINKGKR